MHLKHLSCQSANAIFLGAVSNLEFTLQQQNIAARMAKKRKIRTMGDIWFCQLA